MSTEDTIHLLLGGGHVTFMYITFIHVHYHFLSYPLCNATSSPHHDFPQISYYLVIISIYLHKNQKPPPFSFPEFENFLLPTTIVCFSLHVHKLQLLQTLIIETPLLR